MKKAIMIAAATALIAGCGQTSESFVDGALAYCVDQVHATLEQLADESGAYDYMLTPRNIGPEDSQWNLKEVRIDEWTCGFWPGILWMDYELTGNEAVKEQAIAYTDALEFITLAPAYDHDIGFQIFLSYEKALRLTGDIKYKDALVRAADNLCSLYNPAVGTICSWPRNVEWLGGHNTIMDNMINLELLYTVNDFIPSPLADASASALSSPNEYAAIANSHADHTMQYNFRENGSSAHVAIYNPESGEFLRKITHQGYADDSMWARGQAWGIYGFTMCYRFTRDEKYLAFAEKITDHYLSRLPEDGVPYWDFDDPDIPDAFRDASAGAIVASALIELSQYSEKGAEYLAAAEKTLVELDKNYRGGPDTPAILKHSVGHKPAGSEIDYSINYADYYYMEALMRLKGKQR